MAKGIPKAGGGASIAALPVKRLTNAPLVKIGAFKVMQEKEDQKTGEKYEIEQVKLSLDFDSGYPLADEDGNPILDQDGEEQVHYINEGFVTLSGNERAKFVAILKALGFDDPRFIEHEGKGAGGLTDEAAESLTATFGVNALGMDMAGKEWDDLPFYEMPSRGGKVAKREIEVPVTSLTIMGREIIGRHLDMAITIKNGYNRVETYFQSESPVPLDDKPAPAKGTPKPRTRKTDKANTRLDDPVEDDPLPQGNATVAESPQPETKHAKYVVKVLKAHEVPEPFYVRVAQLMSGSGNDDFTRIEDIPVDAARNFKEMYQSDESLVEQAVETAMKGDASGAPFTPDEEDDEDF